VPNDIIHKLTKFSFIKSVPNYLDFFSTHLIRSTFDSSWRDVHIHFLINFLPLLLREEASVTSVIEIAMRLLLVVSEQASLRTTEATLEIHYGFFLIVDVALEADAVIAVLTGQYFYVISR
jgi:hypothetical protein